MNNQVAALKAKPVENLKKRRPRGDDHLIAGGFNRDNLQRMGILWKFPWTNHGNGREPRISHPHGGRTIRLSKLQQQIATFFSSNQSQKPAWP